MTNEEIVKEIEMQYFEGLIPEQSTRNRIPKEFIKPIQDLTRSDERTRLIQEIEEWSKKIFEIDVAWKEKLNAKLNSLKQ